MLLNTYLLYIILYSGFVHKSRTAKVGLPQSIQKPLSSKRDAKKLLANHRPANQICQCAGIEKKNEKETNNQTYFTRRQGKPLGVKVLLILHLHRVKSKNVRADRKSLFEWIYSHLPPQKLCSAQKAFKKFFYWLHWTHLKSFSSSIENGVIVLSISIYCAAHNQKLHIEVSTRRPASNAIFFAQL